MDPESRRPSPSFVISCLALFIALAGTAAAQVDGGTDGQQRAGSISGKKLKEALGDLRGVIGTKQLKPDSVTSPIIAPAAVTNPDIGRFAVLSNQIGANAITESKIGASTITNGKLKDGAVSTAKIQPEAITTSKIESEAITASKIPPGAINQALLSSESVGTEQLSSAIPSASVRNTTITCRSTGSYSGNHYSTELFDTAGMFPGGNGAGADYSLTAPVNGVYSVTATQVWAADGSGGTRSMEFNGREANNSTPFGPLGSSTVQPINGGAIETPQTLTGVYQLNAGQSVEVWTGASGLAGSSSSCGPTATSFGNTGQRASTLTMTYIAPGPS